MYETTNWIGDINNIINFTTVGDAVSVTEVGVAGWAWWAWSTHA